MAVTGLYKASAPGRFMADCFGPFQWVTRGWGRATLRNRYAADSFPPRCRPAQRIPWHSGATGPKRERAGNSLGDAAFRFCQHVQRA